MNTILKAMIMLFVFFIANANSFAQPDMSKAKCNDCDGKGIITTRTTCTNCENGYYKCPNSKCDAGLVACEVCNGIRQMVVVCPQCEGGGKIDGVICTNCKGNGEILEKCGNCSGMGFFDCTICDGRGEFKCTYCNGMGYRDLSRDCDNCKGTGEVDWPAQNK